MYGYPDGHEVRRENHVIAVADRRRTSHQRFSPHESHQSTGTNVNARYQGSPVLTATEEYDASTIVTQTGSTVHLGSPAQPYSPSPIEGIRTASQQQQLVATSYADTGSVVKYDTEAAAAAETIKAPNTYANLVTVTNPPAQTIEYTQYLSNSETSFQPASTYSYHKPGEPVIFTYPSATQIGSRSSEVRENTRHFFFI